MIRRLIVPLTVAIATLHAGQSFAQGAFPAPLPGQSRHGERPGISAGEWGSACDFLWRCARARWVSGGRHAIFARAYGSASDAGGSFR